MKFQSIKVVLTARYLFSITENNNTFDLKRIISQEFDNEWQKYTPYGLILNETSNH